MKRGWKICLGVGLPILAVALAFAIACYRARSAVGRYKAQLRAQGEKLSITELIPPSPPAADNGAQEFMNASAALNIPYQILPTAMTMIHSGRARIAWREATLPTRESTNVWPALKSHLQDYEATLAGIRAAVTRPVLQFPRNYQQGFSGVSPHVMRLRSSVQAFSAAALLSMHERKTAEAFENLRALIVIPSRSGTDPLIISHLVRVAMLAVATRPTWEWLQYPDWKDEHMAELQNLWTSFNVIDALESCYEMERAFAMLEYSKVRNDPNLLSQIATAGGATTGTALDEIADLGQGVLEDPDEGLQAILDRFPRRWTWQWWNSYWDELWTLKVHQINLKHAREIPRAPALLPVLQQHEAQIEALGLPSRQLLFAREMSSGIWTTFVRKVITAEAQRRIVFTAIAIKRFEKRHGKLPTTLSELTPGLLPNVTLDPIDGQPLRYRTSSEGTFVLYSIGLDGKDDGGDPSPLNSQSKSFWWTAGRDWVWPTPASPEEVREYHGTLESQGGRSAR